MTFILLQKPTFDFILCGIYLLNRSDTLKTTIAIVTVAVLGFGVCVYAQNPTTVISIKANEVGADGQGRGFMIRIGDVATLSAERFELEQPAAIRLLDNVQLVSASGTSMSDSFTVKSPSSGGVTIRLFDLVITADGAEPYPQLGVLQLLGDVRIRQEQLGR